MKSRITCWGDHNITGLPWPSVPNGFAGIPPLPNLRRTPGWVEWSSYRVMTPASIAAFKDNMGTLIEGARKSGADQVANKITATVCQCNNEDPYVCGRARPHEPCYCQCHKL